MVFVIVNDQGYNDPQEFFVSQLLSVVILVQVNLKYALNNIVEMLIEAVKQ